MVVGGAVVVGGGPDNATVHDAVAGDGSVLPTASVATTETVCRPSPRPVNEAGDVHACAAPPSSEHANVDPASLEENATDALDVATVPDGAEPIVVCGAVASTVHVRVAGVGSGLPAASLAVTISVCEPSLSAVYCSGDRHGVAAAPSSLHMNVEPASLDENVNVALALLVGADGPATIVGIGRRGVDGPASGRGRRVGVAGRVGGDHLDGVRAVAKPVVGLGRGACDGGAAVELARERGARVGR